MSTTCWLTSQLADHFAIGELREYNCIYLASPTPTIRTGIIWSVGGTNSAPMGFHIFEVEAPPL